MNDRLNYGIQFSREHWANSRNEVTAKLGHDVVGELNFSNLNTLQQPVVASAILVGAPGLTNLTQLQTYRLYVLWLEDQPTVSAVELSITDSRAPIRLPISDVDKEDNQIVAKQNVTFTANFHWNKDSSVAGNLDRLSTNMVAKVRLLRDSKVVTDWYPVSFFKMDHWIVNIPNPHETK